MQLSVTVKLPVLSFTIRWVQRATLVVSWEVIVREVRVSCPALTLNREAVGLVESPRPSLKVIVLKVTVFAEQRKWAVIDSPVNCVTLLLIDAVAESF